MEIDSHAPQWVDRLATLSGFRDRELLDVSLASALRDLLQPRLVAVWRCVGQPGDERWLLRARLGLNDRAALSDPVGVAIDDLPPLPSQPERWHSLQQRRVTQTALPEGGCCSRFPLASDRDLVGVLELHTPVPPGDAEQRMVASLLRLYGNVLGLLDYSERDTLTGLLNRKTFDESFMRLAGQLGLAANDASEPAVASQPPATRRGGGPQSVWLGMVDIDHFKRVNDQYGHLIGDEVLLLVSRLMRNCFRFDDQLYRFGGEEFVVLMRCQEGAGAADAAGAFERLRRHVQDFAFPRVGQVTVSVGFTQVRRGDTPSVAFERADQAVYHAKQHGRNQVHEHAALVAAGQLQDSARDSDIELF
jgi:diguanylate cyclase (GGDEF)-like protein